VLFCLCSFVDVVVVCGVFVPAPPWRVRCEMEASESERRFLELSQQAKTAMIEAFGAALARAEEEVPPTPPWRLHGAALARAEEEVPPAPPWRHGKAPPLPTVPTVYKRLLPTSKAMPEERTALASRAADKRKVCDDAGLPAVPAASDDSDDAWGDDWPAPKRPRAEEPPAQPSAPAQHSESEEADTAKWWADPEADTAWAASWSAGSAASSLQHPPSEPEDDGDEMEWYRERDKPKVRGPRGGRNKDWYKERYKAKWAKEAWLKKRS
jgi:hypothetical protein